jgi:hypothetical protein
MFPIFWTIIITEYHINYNFKQGKKKTRFRARLKGDIVLKLNDIVSEPSVCYGSETRAH